MRSALGRVDAVRKVMGLPMRVKKVDGTEIGYPNEVDKAAAFVQRVGEGPSRPVGGTGRKELVIRTDLEVLGMKPAVEVDRRGEEGAE